MSTRILPLLGSNGGLSKKLYGVGIGPLLKILAAKYGYADQIESKRELWYFFCLLRLEVLTSNLF